MISRFIITRCIGQSIIGSSYIKQMYNYQMHRIVYNTKTRPERRVRHRRPNSAAKIYTCTPITFVQRERQIERERERERDREIYIQRERERDREIVISSTWISGGRAQLPYSTLSANSVKQVFPFRACKNSPKQPPTYFRGGQNMASGSTGGLTPQLRFIHIHQLLIIQYTCF